MKLRTYTFFILIMGLFTFFFSGTVGESLKVVNKSNETEIPEQAIRLRILANSDSLKDQVLKRKVRDEVIKEIGAWETKPKNIKEARDVISKKLPLFHDIAKKTINKYGFTYSVRVELGKVPFPTKLYGSKVYPAGEYEALRITIGEGKGGNWWCVLFPPLCFVDMSNGDAIEKKTKSEDMETISEPVLSASTKKQIYKVTKRPEIKETKKETEEIVEVRFLLADKIKSLFQ